MTLSFDPDSLSLPIGHFIGDRLIPAKNGIDMHRPSDGIEYAGCRRPMRRWSMRRCRPPRPR